MFMRIYIACMSFSEAVDMTSSPRSQINSKNQRSEEQESQLDYNLTILIKIQAVAVGWEQGDMCIADIII